MKHNILRGLALVVCLLMTVSLCACNGSEGGNSSETAKKETESKGDVSMNSSSGPDSSLLISSDEKGNESTQETGEKLYSAEITSEGMRNALKRAKQILELTWTPVADTMPGFYKANGEYQYFNYTRGETYTGVPYSSVYETDTYFGTNASIETYISALCNPKSKLYTDNLRNRCNEPKAVTYYGTVCSKFVCYCLDITETYNTQHVGTIPGMKLLFARGSFDVNKIQPADVLNKPSSHTVLVTDILRDKDGVVKYIEVTDETTSVKPNTRCRRMTVEEFLETYKEYNMHRYQYLDSVTYQKSNFVNILDENAKLDDRKYDVLTRYGDKCNIAWKSGSQVTLDILTKSWKKAVVTFGGKAIKEIDITGKDSFAYQPEKAGYYKIELKNGNKTSRPCYFCMYDAVLKVNPSAAGKFETEYSSSTGKAIWFQLGAIGDSVYKKSNGSGKETIAYTEGLSQNTIRAAFENEYGVYMSNWANRVSK